MRIVSLSVRLLVVTLLAISFQPAFAQAHPHGSNDNGSVDPTFEKYASAAAELTARSRANIYFQNPQSMFKGVQVNFVNVGSGNLTFVRRDLVAFARIPIVIARVYDSRNRTAGDFGQGWSLSIAETISLTDSGARLFSETGEAVEFVKTESGFQLAKDRPSDYQSLSQDSDGALIMTLTTGFVKRFTSINGTFRLSLVTDRNGNQVRLSYTDGKVLRVESGTHSVDLTRDAQGHIAAARGDDGRSVRYSYDKGQLARVQDIGGHEWKYMYTATGLLKTATDPMGRLNFSASFDDMSRVTALTMPSGTITYRYDDNTTTVTDRKNLVSKFVQNTEGITVSATNPLGENTSITLDAARNVTAILRNNATVESLGFDSVHRLTTRTAFSGAASTNSTYSYDGNSSRLKEIRNGTEVAQSFTFDARGNLASANSRSGARQYTFSASGDLDKRFDGTTQLGLSFSTDGLITGITEGTTAVTKVEQNPNGTLHSIAFADGRATEYKYYPSGLRSQLAYRDGRRVEYNYDAAGNLVETRIFDSKGKQVGGQKLEVDASYRLVGRAQFSGERSTFEYDPNGNLEKIIEGKQVTRFEYDSLDRLVAIISADGKRLASRYQSGQPSALEAYDHSSISVSARVDTGLSFAPASEVFANRPVVGVLGPVRFSSSLGTFQMSNAAGDEVATPDALIEDALVRTRIIGADAQQPLSARQNEFNRPFNSLFIPGEYLAVNCCPLCIAGHFASCFNCDPPPPPPDPIPTITPNNELWYFGGEPSDPGFTQGATTITLTATGVSAGSFAWNVSPGPGTAKATFPGNVTSSSKQNVNTITLTSQAESATVSDEVLVSLTYTGPSGVPSTVSALFQIEAPATLAHISESTTGTIDCSGTSAGTFGYDTRITYEVRSKLAGVPVAFANINEQFDFALRSDRQTNNWMNPVAHPTQTGGPNGAQFADQLCVADPTNVLIPHPTPPFLSNGSLVMCIPQHWRSGSTLIGFGEQVQLDNACYSTDHGQHSFLF